MAARIAEGAQLALNVQLRDEATLDNFVAGPATGALRTLLMAGAEQLIFLHGPSEGGKTHLLQAACRHNPEPALYLPLHELVQASPQDVLGGLEQLELLCMDDLQAVANNPDWALALFDCFHRCQQSGTRWLLAAERPPGALPVALPDLQSRLAAGLIYALPAPDDELRKRILISRARERGLVLTEEVATYIERRAGRSLRALLQLLEVLDAASLRSQRALSIPFVREIMRW